MDGTTRALAATCGVTPGRWPEVKFMLNQVLWIRLLKEALTD